MYQEPYYTNDLYYTETVPCDTTYQTSCGSTVSTCSPVSTYECTPGITCPEEMKANCPKLEIEDLITPEFERKVEELKCKCGGSAELDIMVEEDNPNNLLTE